MGTGPRGSWHSWPGEQAPLPKSLKVVGLWGPLSTTVPFSPVHQLFLLKLATWVWLSRTAWGLGFILASAWSTPLPHIHAHLVLLAQSVFPTVLPVNTGLGPM